MIKSFMWVTPIPASAHLAIYWNYSPFFFFFLQYPAFTALKIMHTHTEPEALRQRRHKKSYGSKWETLHLLRDVQFQYPGFWKEKEIKL